MSTDDSISEDVSSSVALSHDHTSASGGKESEASIVSSEDTVSGLAIPEKERPAARQVQTLEGLLQAAEGAVKSRPSGTPACNISHKIRNLCLRTEEEFSSGRSLPFINPSSLETLRALVHEIQSSGETDPEIWKNCEGRWLHLFQLVEKQYQEQILAQQEQYQCQIQLIQDEIKALVQLQNRQSGAQTHPSDSSPREAKVSEPPVNLTSGSQTFTPAPGHLSPQQLAANPQESSDEGLVTVLSSGYGTLSAWEAGLEPGATEGKDEAPWSPKQPDCSLQHLPLVETSLHGQDSVPSRILPPNNAPHTTASTVPSPSAEKQRLNSQPLTSWAQKQKHRQRKSKRAQNRSPQMERRGESRPGGPPEEHKDNMDDPGCTAAHLNPVPLKRSDSLVSEASGLTYWKLDESELYRPLPDSFESNSLLFMQDMSLSQPLADEARLSLSLREIYQSKQKADPKGQEWDSLINSDASSPQVLALDPTLHVRQSDRTSGFTSPSHFSSPSLNAQPRPCTSSGAPVSPDSMALRSHTDTDCLSNASSLSAHQGMVCSPTSPTFRTVNLANSEDEGSHTATVTLRPTGQARVEPSPIPRKLKSSTSLDDPVVLSLLRQNLREKHARHIADLRAYYEAEISTLKEKLDLVNLPLDMEKSNRMLLERCEHLERALTEASVRIRELETRNQHLERQLTEWPERYDAASSMVQALQQRVEETKQCGREKDNTVTKLRSRLRHLEEALQNACKEVDEKEARMNKEHKMLQDLLQEYDSLRNDHEAVKNNLVSTENKLFDANEQISELKRVISKLEAQVKQLEHENMARTRQALHSHSQPSGAGLFHHPDLLLSPGKRQRDVECSTKNGVSDKGALHGRPRLSPPEREQPQEQPTAKELKKRDVPLTPMMKALIHMEETKATEGRALSKASYSRLGRRRPTVAFLDSVREPLLERGSAVLRAQRSLSPEGHRSSSLPPRAQRAGPPSTPTKRETLIQPLSAKSSPKRCPTENCSTAFDRPLPCQQHMHNRFDLHFDQRGFSSLLPSQPNSRTRLQFMQTEKPQVDAQPSTGSADPADSSEAEENATSSGLEDQEAAVLLLHDPDDDDGSLSYQAQIHSLADAEKLFDELTLEKQQIEAALSRIPGAGARVTLQTRLDEVTLENRLEKVNRDLGSIRMTLKRFNILRSSSNI
ncbi:M-phase phosphoprotein 9 [Pygocentrus nattereri]|uniref:M-phase phosphoprotein 9 n=1 Tax=Pygocentrus nattereri TaxID=42514 RepID=UPI0008145598|nr:M-phase phosphoprotein 9 [Pygocentrus nattereri]